MNKFIKYCNCWVRSGWYLFYNELKIKKKEIELKTGKKIKIVAISAKNKNKKRNLK